MATKAIKIDVVSDVICPWCFLGKHRLEKAISQVPEVSVTVRWRPFFLDPNIPAGGVARKDYLTAKFGEARLATLHDPLVKAGQEEGVPYNFDKITRTPNTLDAHRLIRWAANAGKQGDMVTALFNAYWRDGEDIGDRATLARLAGACGLDGKAIAAEFEKDTNKLQVHQEVRQAQTMGIQGVPTFIFGESMGITGAQSVDVLVDGIRRAAGL
jgi:predicted DsbA family dithiol-disulfide isomerase